MMGELNETDYSYWEFSNGARFKSVGTSNYEYALTRSELFAKFRWEVELPRYQGQKVRGWLLYNPEQKEVYKVWRGVDFGTYGWPEEDPRIEGGRYKQRFTWGEVNREAEEILYEGVLVAGLFPNPIKVSNDYLSALKTCNNFKDAIKILNYCEYVDQGIKEGWLSEDPYGNNEFKPNNNVTRAEFAKMLAVARYGKETIKNFNCSESPFPDVSNNWSRQPICYLKEQGLVNGDKYGKFKPDQHVTLYEGLKMVLKAYGFSTDCYASEDAAWYEQYVIGGVLSGLISNATDRSLSRGESVKLVGEGKNKGEGEKVCDAGEVREFKTSLPKVNLRSGRGLTYDVVESVVGLKSRVYVLRQAQKGEYVDDYKTDRWYEVVSSGENGMSRGWVLATLVHISKIGGVVVDDNFVSSGWNRINNVRVTGIVLHFTGGSGTAKNARNSDDNRNGLGAHYFVDREGQIAQTLPDYKKMGHSGYEWGQPTIRGTTSPYICANEFTLGIEIINWGVAIDNGENHYKSYTYNDIPNEEVLNIKDENSKIWQIWNSEHNYAWGDSGVSNTNQETWQSYTKDSSNTIQLQLESVDRLVEYLEERYGIPPNKYFQYDIPYDYENLPKDEKDKYSFYYYPNDPTERASYNDKVCSIKAIIENGEIKRDSNGNKIFRKEDLENIENYFWGIFQHHNMTGKYDAGPALIIDDLQNIRLERN